MVIADRAKPLGAGRRDGRRSLGRSRPRPRDVLLEVAFFRAGRRSPGAARRYGLVTDASQRFERGVDPTLQERAIERATQLLLDCAGGAARTGRGD